MLASPEDIGGRNIPGDSLNAVRNDLSGLQRESHAFDPVSEDEVITDWQHSLTFPTHGETIRDSNGIVLPCKHAFLLHGSFHRLAQVEDWLSVSRVIHVCPLVADSRKLLKRYSRCMLDHATSDNHAPKAICKSILLARVSLPPYRSHTHVRAVLHHFAIWDPGCIKHGLISVSCVPLLATDLTWAPGKL